ncbi:uncharacterized protein LOC133425437 [Cololabis saira]|uniref:uncharacterized protein LOC133425437 n=1 Tax=Cololabis saira TaxID=129043 RepID=UPI002AD4E2F8|nr:uncharacterized protein LOC133425437 [Cololabis saira]
MYLLGLCSLDTTSGCLTLSNVTHEHSGRYTPEVNYDLEDPTEIQVICIITDDHGPVESSWKLGNKYRPGNTLNITQLTRQMFRLVVSAQVDIICTESLDMKFKIVLFLILLNGAVIFSGKADPYRELGSSFVLCPDSVTPPLTNITWKHGVDLAVDWSGGNVTFYRISKDHCSLNTTTGCLTISNVTHDQSGRYTSQVNYEDQNPIEIKVLLPVHKPTVSSNCYDEKSHCILTCEGNIIDDHGPVRPFWIISYKYRPGDTLKITQENQESFIPCVLENPVGFKQSEILPNPLISTPVPKPTVSSHCNDCRDGVDWIRVILGVIVAFLIIAVLVLLWCLKRRSNPVNSGMDYMQLNTDDENYEPTVRQELMNTGNGDDNSGSESDY